MKNRSTSTSRLFVVALTAAALGFGSLAVAQDRGGRHERDDRGAQMERGGDRGRPGDHRGPPGRHDMRHDDRAHWGAGPDHNFRRGGRLPPQYRSRQYVVDDWRGHHLHAPPRGYHWVQTGGDYVLAAIATGVILDILLN